MDIAEVRIWGELAGAVAWDDAAGLATFEFDPRFKSKGWDLAPLQMPISDARNLFVFPALRNKTEPALDSFKGLPGLLADVLPDRYGNQLINLWLAGQGRPQNSMNPVEMLCFIGTRGMGALEFEPAVWKRIREPSLLRSLPWWRLQKHALQKRDLFNQPRSGREKAMSELLRIGTSAGGARPKAVIAWNEKTGEVRSGQTNAPKGFEHWLLKLDGVSDVQLGSSTAMGGWKWPTTTWPGPAASP